MNRVPHILASNWHISALTLLGIYLVVLPLFGVHVPAKFELVGGNYTNIISAIAAGIASSAGVKVVKAHKSLRDEIYALLGQKAQVGVESSSQGQSPAGVEQVQGNGQTTNPSN